MLFVFSVRQCLPIKYHELRPIHFTPNKEPNHSLFSTISIILRLIVWLRDYISSQLRHSFVNTLYLTQITGWTNYDVVSLRLNGQCNTLFCIPLPGFSIKIPEVGGNSVNSLKGLLPLL